MGAHLFVKGTLRCPPASAKKKERGGRHGARERGGGDARDDDDEGPAAQSKAALGRPLRGAVAHAVVARLPAARVLAVYRLEILRRMAGGHFLLMWHEAEDKRTAATRANTVRAAASTCMEVRQNEGMHCMHAGQDIAMVASITRATDCGGAFSGAIRGGPTQ